MSNPTERRDDQPTPHARRGRPRRDRKEKNLRLHKLLPKPRQWQDAAVAFTPSRYHPGGRARHPVGRASQSLQQVRVRDPGASPPSPTAGSAAQHAGGASIASNPLDFDVASTYRQAGGAALINGSIGRTTTPHGPGVPEEFLGLTRPGPDAVYNLRERIPVRLEDLYTSRSLNCWAACTCSPKTIIKEQFISNLWGIPLQKLLFGMRIEIGTKDFSEMKYDQLVWEEAFLTGQIEGWDPGSIDVPGWDIELGMLHSMYIQGGYRLYIRLTEGSVDGGFAEPPPTRGGGVASIRDRLGPWNSGPPWSTPNGTYVFFIHGRYPATNDQNPISTAPEPGGCRCCPAAPVACAYHELFGWQPQHLLRSSLTEGSIN